jgi:hypothetical protein
MVFCSASAAAASASDQLRFPLQQQQQQQASVANGYSNLAFPELKEESLYISLYPCSAATTTLLPTDALGPLLGALR